MKMLFRRATVPDLPAVLAILAAWLVIVFLPLAWQVSAKGQAAGMDNAIGVQYYLGIAFLMYVGRKVGFREIGLRSPDWGQSGKLLIVPLLNLGLLFALALSAAQLRTSQQMAMVAINVAAIGFGEELLFRGILWSSLRKALAFWPAILLGSAIFGIVHVINTILSGDLPSAVIQAMAAFLSAFGDLALRIRCRSIVPIAILHGLWDFVTLGIAASTPEAAAGGLTVRMVVSHVVLVLPMALYGLWLLRGGARLRGWRTDRPG